MKHEDRIKIVNGFLELMEKGVAPWSKGWKAGQRGGARNAASNRKYRGGNVILTWVAIMLNGYTSSRWLTWKQVKDAGGTVRDGEAKKYTWLYRPYTYIKRDPKTRQPILNAKGEPEKGIGFTAFHVYNVDQCSGLPDAIVLGKNETPLPEVPEDFGCPEADEIFNGYLTRTGIGIQVGGGMACYSPGKDLIRLPEKARYVAVAEERIAGGADRSQTYQNSLAEFYGTSFHEAIHSTGHSSRLDRGLDKGKGFFKEEYAFEELVAELGAAFVMADLGLPGHCQHVEYLASWASGMRDKPEAFFKAATLAAAAADLVSGDAFKDAEEDSSSTESTDESAMPAPIAEAA